VTDLFTKEESTSHRTGILVAHPLQRLPKACRTAEKDSAVCIGVFIGYGLEYPVPLSISLLVLSFPFREGIRVYGGRDEREAG
jgi:hypothetical protein